MPQDLLRDVQPKVSWRVVTEGPQRELGVWLGRKRNTRRHPEDPFEQFEHLKSHEAGRPSDIRPVWSRFGAENLRARCQSDAPDVRR